MMIPAMTFSVDEGALISESTTAQNSVEVRVLFSAVHCFAISRNVGALMAYRGCEFPK